MAKNTANTLTITKEKANGRIYTPDYIVNNILDLCGYNGTAVLGRHIIDNSCGDGAFLAEVVRRYCSAAQAVNMPSEQLGTELGQFIHGVEIDNAECENCIANITNTAAEFGVYNICWDISVGDTLTVRRYNGMMDYVVGNPPYVRVHNLLDSYDAVKGYSFAQNGMTDLFIVFYELGLRMLNDTGILGYITPSSLFNSLAGSSMRRHLICYRNIKAVVDLKHFQPFEAITYTTIMILAKQPQESVMYYEYDEINLIPITISELVYEDFCMNGFFIFGGKAELNELKSIMSYTGGKTYCEVKNGFATLCDDFFIGDWLFDDYTIPVIKASTGKQKKCLFPYGGNGKLLPFETVAANPAIRSHYEQNEEKLKRRSLESPGAWYGFGRSQGINDVGRKKYAINSLIRGVADIKLYECMPGTGVYSGLYILTEHNMDELKSVLFTEEFAKYVAMLGKYKNGGYYTYSSKDLQRYINYKFGEKDGHKYEQFTIS